MLNVIGVHLKFILQVIKDKKLAHLNYVIGALFQNGGEKQVCTSTQNNGCERFRFRATQKSFVRLV